MTLVFDDELSSARFRRSTCWSRARARTAPPGRRRDAAPTPSGCTALVDGAERVPASTSAILERRANFPLPLATDGSWLAPSAAELAAEPDSPRRVLMLAHRLPGRRLEWRADALRRPGQHDDLLLRRARRAAQQGRLRAAARGLRRRLGGNARQGDQRAGPAQRHGALADARARMSRGPSCTSSSACRLQPEQFRDSRADGDGHGGGTSSSAGSTTGARPRTSRRFRTLAYARKGKQTLFCEALLDCVRGGAAAELREEGGTERWTITHMSLAERLAEYVPQLAGDAGAEQSIRSDGFGVDAVVHYLDAPPTVARRARGRSRGRARLHADRDPRRHRYRSDAGPAAEATRTAPLRHRPPGRHLHHPGGDRSGGPAYVALPGRARPLRAPRVRRVLKVTP